MITCFRLIVYVYLRQLIGTHVWRRGCEIRADISHEIAKEHEDSMALIPSTFEPPVSRPNMPLILHKQSSQINQATARATTSHSPATQHTSPSRCECLCGRSQYEPKIDHCKRTRREAPKAHLRRKVEQHLIPSSSVKFADTATE